MDATTLAKVTGSKSATVITDRVVGDRVEVAGIATTHEGQEITACVHLGEFYDIVQDFRALRSSWTVCELEVFAESERIAELLVAELLKALETR